MGYREFDAVSVASRATNASRDVLRILARRMDDEGQAWPSADLVAFEAGVEVRTCRRALASLVAQGELEIVERGGGRGRTTAYRLGPRLRAAQQHLAELQARGMRLTVENLKAVRQAASEKPDAIATVVRCENPDALATFHGRRNSDRRAIVSRETMTSRTQNRGEGNHETVTIEARNPDAALSPEEKRRPEEAFPEGSRARAREVSNRPQTGASTYEKRDPAQAPDDVIGTETWECACRAADAIESEAANRICGTMNGRDLFPVHNAGGVERARSIAMMMDAFAGSAFAADRTRLHVRTDDAAGYLECAIRELVAHARHPRDRCGRLVTILANLRRDPGWAFHGNGFSQVVEAARILTGFGIILAAPIPGALPAHRSGNRGSRAGQPLNENEKPAA